MSEEQNVVTWASVLEWLRSAAPWITTFALSVFGAVVHYAQRMKRSGAKFSWGDLMLDTLICVFVGMVTHLLCELAKVDDVTRSLLVALSAHQGTRALMQYERIRDRLLGLSGRADQ